MTAAQAALARGDFNYAIIQAGEALKVRPDDPTAKQILARAQKAKSDQADYDRALKVARDAIAKGDNPKAIEILTLVLQGWPGDAVATQMLAQARGAKPEEANYDLALGAAQRALDAGDYDTAIERAREALKLRPQDRKATDILTRASLRKGEVAKEGVPPAAPEPPAPEKRTPVPVTPPAEVTPAPAAPEIAETPPAAIRTTRGPRHEVAASADFLLGQGNVTMPFGFSLAEVPGLGQNIAPNVAKPDRNSIYVGATVSYSYGQAWYFDVGYAHGTSSGDVDVLLGSPPTLPSSFKIDDNWYQAYLRYTFPALRGKRFGAYLRAGFSFVQADLTDSTVIPALGLYQQTDKTDDLLGNLGFGISYSLYSSRRAKLAIQFEGEGFYGQRSQETIEVLPEAGVGFPFPKVKIDNDLYGGIGRGTVRFEYRLGQSGLFKIFVEGGLQGKFTMINYPGQLNFNGGTFNELLWGPYAKAGLRYSF